MLFSTNSKIYARRTVLLQLYRLWDFLLFLTSFILAVYIENPLFDYTEIVQLFFKNYLFFISVITIWFISCSYMNLYESNRLYNINLLKTFKVTSFCVAFIVVSAAFFNNTVNTPRFILSLWSFNLSSMILTRVLLYKLLAFTRLKDRNLRHIIIAGIGERGQKMAQSLLDHPEVGYRVIGFVDKSEQFKHFNLDIKDIHFLGGLEDFPSIISKTSVDEVFICLPIKSAYDEIHTLVNQCKEQGVPARLASDFFHLNKVKVKTGFIDNAPIITLYNGMEESLQISFKRFLDIFISGTLLILLLPLFLLITALIKLTDPGSIFFSQQRIGLHKRKFSLYKFRTMVENAEALQVGLENMNEASGPVFKISNDPRITKIGGSLRRYSIDELPQLFNVFKGDMSLVGPRPLPLRDFEKFESDWTRRRFSVRPGITCIWQISGRSNISFEQWMEQDLQYIDNWTLMLDLKILLKTVPVIIKGTGAY